MLSFETALLSQMCLEFPPVIGRIEYLNLSPANPMCAYMYPPSHSDRCSRPAVYATQNNARLMTHYYTSTGAIIHGTGLIITRPPGKLYTAHDSLLHVHQGNYTRLATHYYTSTREIIHGLWPKYYTSTREFIHCSQLITTRPPGKIYASCDSLLHVHQGIFPRLATHYYTSTEEIVHGTRLFFTSVV